MYTKKEMLYIKALSPVHAGTGQGLGSVDMPIQRESHSDIPKIEGSGLKGAIRSLIYTRKFSGYKKRNSKVESFAEKNFNEVFGCENNENAGRIAFTDAKLLFLPINSDQHIFKLVTCPYILKRWVEELTFTLSTLKQDSALANKLKALYTSVKGLSINEGKCICSKSQLNNVFLDGYEFEIKEDDDVIKNIADIIGFNSSDKERITIIKDEEFRDLVAIYTEIITRNRIDINTGVTEKGGLFTEEYLPVESVLYFVTLASPQFNNFNEKSDSIGDETAVIKYINDNISVGSIFQVGGNATIGKGLVKVINKNYSEEVRENVNN